MNYILVINAGSSSLKYQIIDMDDESVKAKGLVERIGISGSKLTHKPAGKEPFELEQDMPTHGEAINAVIAALVDPEHGIMKDMSAIKAVGHRVLHGGERFWQSVIVNDDVIDGIKEYIPLGPLHNPANLKGIETCMEKMPGIPNVAVFDTAFHQTMPDYAYLYGLPYDAYKEHKIRKYGFHGTSHRYISMMVPKLLNRSAEGMKLVTCHLGNGSSLAAVKDGKCIDTTMGLTPLEGLVMGTRAGDIDSAAIPYLMEKYNMTAEETVTFLNKKCGVLGVSGLSSDFRDLEDASKAGHEGAIRALNMFNYRVKKYIGAFAAAMGGLDVIAFAGGVGENDTGVRANCLKGLEFLGVKLDLEKNNVRGKTAIISAPDSKVTVMVVPTNEELMIARETYELCK